MGDSNKEFNLPNLVFREGQHLHYLKGFLEILVELNFTLLPGNIWHDLKKTWTGQSNGH